MPSSSADKVSSSQPGAELHTLFPPIEPFRSGFLDVDSGHRLYYEESGNPQGKPVIHLHGGPGGGTTPLYRRFWDPQKYRIVLMDQRGSGKSTPHASLGRNTTQALVEDIETLRGHLGIQQWQVFGGSWGSTLSLIYAQTFPERITELVLRGIFLLRKEDIHWFYQEGASRLYPDAWEYFLAPIPPEERDNLVEAYYRRLTSEDEKVRLEAAKAWSIWEGTTSRLWVDPQKVAETADPTFAEAFARIECHYFINGGFIEEAQILRDIDRIRHIPTVIVHGRYDVVCPIGQAWALHRAFPEAELRITQGSGHSMSEPETLSALISATQKFSRT